MEGERGWGSHFRGRRYDRYREFRAAEMMGLDLAVNGSLWG
jgi:hypothetical protein